MYQTIVVVLIAALVIAFSLIGFLGSQEHWAWNTGTLGKAESRGGRGRVSRGRGREETEPLGYPNYLSVPAPGLAAGPSKSVFSNLRGRA